MRTEPNPRLIGSTDVAAILGEHPWLTGFELWRRLAYGDEQSRDRIALRRMETGLMLQDQVAAWFLDDHNLAANAAVVGPYVEQPEGRVWQRCSSDYVIPLGIGTGEPEGLEIKTTERLGDDWGAEGTDEIPSHYFMQVQVQMHVFRWKRMHVAIRWGLSGVRYYVVEANEGVGAGLATEAKRFWEEYVIPRVPPPMTEIESQRERWAALRKKFGLPGFIEREAAPREVELALAIAAQKAAKKAADEAISPLELELRESMGDAGLVHWDGGPKKGSRVICRPQKQRTHVDWEAIATARGATQDEITAHSKLGDPVRPMRITIKGQKEAE